MTKTIFIHGDQGTTGLDIKERLAKLSGVNIISLPDDKRKDPEWQKTALNDCDLAILCLPDEAAKEAVAMVENNRVKILDCSTAHRTTMDWVYGLPEYSPEQAGMIERAMRVANPGCYPTGAILMLAPLRRAGILADDYPLSIFGLSGYSGGGRKMIESYQTKKMAGEVYGLNQNHKHLAEIADYGLLAHPPLFVPMVGDFLQGMVITIPLRLHNIMGDDIMALWRSAYGDNDTINFWEGRERVRGDEYAKRDDMALMVMGNGGRLSLVACYDNLGKGAGGQAVQNIKIMLGL